MVGLTPRRGAFVPTQPDIVNRCGLGSVSRERRVARIPDHGAEVAMTAPVPGLEPAFEVDARLGPLEDHGVTRAGHRRVVAVAGGRVSGLFDAEILPGGADWQIVRPDGAVEIDTRYSARTAAGE